LKVNITASELPQTTIILSIFSTISSPAP